MSYTIVQIKNVYHPDIQGIGRPRIYEENGERQEFETLDEAFAKIDEVESESYRTQNGEAGAPDYYVLESVGFLEEKCLDEYTWDGCECEHDCCGDCLECQEHMMREDVCLVCYWAESKPENEEG